VDDGETTTEYCNLEKFNLREWAQAMAVELVTATTDEQFDDALVRCIGALAEKLHELDKQDLQPSTNSSFGDIRLFWGYILHRGLKSYLNRRKIYFQCVPVAVYDWVVTSEKLKEQVLYGIWDSESVVDLPVLQNDDVPTLGAFIGKLVICNAPKSKTDDLEFVLELYVRVLNAVHRSMEAKKMPFWTIPD
jgi:hypothetical protein